MTELKETGYRLETGDLGSTKEILNKIQTDFVSDDYFLLETPREYLSGKVSELTEEIKKLNPLKIKDELITKHCFYEYKVKELLLALMNGMRPAKLYNGTDSAIAGMLFITADGEVLCYQRAFRQTLADFLYFNTHLTKGSMLHSQFQYLPRSQFANQFVLFFTIQIHSYLLFIESDSVLVITSLFPLHSCSPFKSSQTEVIA